MKTKNIAIENKERTKESEKTLTEEFKNIPADNRSINQ